jgi:3-oxoacyl-[acyl-carrier protein] reductase
MGILEGKVGFVTGGGRGIGRGHCLHLAEQGAAVVVNDVDLTEAQKVADEIAVKGGRAVASDADIGSRKGAQELVSRCVEEFGGVHCAVNNAGIVRDRSFLKMSDEEWESVMRIHASGTFWCAQEAALRMRDQGSGGAIVNTVSAAHMGNFGQTNYGGAKGGRGEGGDRLDDLHLGERALALRHPRECNQPLGHDPHVREREGSRWEGDRDALRRPDAERPPRRLSVQ